jgi:hypothetical protein
MSGVGALDVRSNEVAVISYSKDREARIAVSDILARSVRHVSFVMSGSPSMIVILSSATVRFVWENIHMGHHDSSESFNIGSAFAKVLCGTTEFGWER